MVQTVTRRVLIISLVTVVLGTAVTGCSGAFAQRAADLQARVDQLEKQVSDLTAKNRQLQQTVDEFTRPVTLYFITNTPTEMYLSRVTRPMAKSGNPLVEAMQELVKGPGVGGDLAPVLPPETQVLGIKVKDGTAYADFSPEILKLNVGSRGEALVLAAIADTLTEFPEVKQVQILVGGKVTESIGGHFAADKPIPRNETVVK